MRVPQFSCILHPYRLLKFTSLTVRHANTKEPTVEAVNVIMSNLIEHCISVNAQNPEQSLHEVLVKVLKMHPLRRTAITALLIVMGQAGILKPPRTTPGSRMEHAQMLKYLCEKCFELTTQNFADDNLVKDHSDNIAMFDPVFAPLNRLALDHPEANGKACVMCFGDFDEMTVLISLPCAHVSWANCLRQLRINIYVDQEGGLYAYRCPGCCRNLVCGTEDCKFHELPNPTRYTSMTTSTPALRLDHTGRSHLSLLLSIWAPKRPSTPRSQVFGLEAQP